MTEHNFNILKNAPDGTHFMIYHHNDELIGKCIWICRKENIDDVKILQTLWGGFNIDNNDFAVYESNSNRYCTLDNIETMNGMMLLFSEDDYNRYIMEQL